MAQKVLMIEDDLDTIELVRDYLQEIGFEFDFATDGESGLAKALSGDHDVVLLDWNLPKLEGLEVCRRIRQENTALPVIMLTTRNEEIDRVLGLELGADDYMAKPFSVRELGARIKAIFRRSGEAGTSSSRQRQDGSKSLLIYGEVIIDIDKRTVTRAGNLLGLTAREFDLLAFLAEHPGRPFTRDQLLDNVWGYQTSGYDRVVNTFIARVRQKVEVDSQDPKLILTVHGIGYKFADFE